MDGFSSIKLENLVNDNKVEEGKRFLQWLGAVLHRNLQHSRWEQQELVMVLQLPTKLSHCTTTIQED